MAIYNESPRIKIYHSIKERLLSNLCELTDVRLWNNHILGQNEVEPYKPPIIFIDWSNDFSYDQLSDGLKSATGEITIKILIEGYNLDKLQIYCLSDKIKSLLDNWNDWQGSPLDLTRVNEEPEFDNLKIINLIFNATWYEWSYPTSLIPIGGTSGINYGICVTFEMDSNLDGNFLRGTITEPVTICSGTTGFYTPPTSTPETPIITPPDLSPEGVTDLIEDNDLPDWSHTPFFPPDDLNI